MSSLNLLAPVEAKKEQEEDANAAPPPWGRTSRRNIATARNILQSVQESVSALRVTKVHLVVSPSSPIVFIHQLMSLNGPKADVIPVADKGRLVGLIFRADLIVRLTPKRFVSLAAAVSPPPLAPLTQQPLESTPRTGGDDPLEQDFVSSAMLL